MEVVTPEQRIQTACLLILSVVAVAGALYWLRPVMIPFVLALFLTLSLAPVVDWQVRRLRFPHSLSVLTTLLLSGVLLTSLGALASASVGQLTQNASLYQDQVARATALVLEFAPRVGFGEQAMREQLAQIPVASVGSMLLRTTNAILDLISKSFLVFIFLVYLLLGTLGQGRPGEGMWGDVAKRVERYIATKAVISAATGIAVGSVLALLGIDLALVFGLFAFLLNFIPSIGSVIATLLPLPVVLVNPEVSTSVAVAAIAIPGVIQMGIGNVLEPKLMGDAMDLHPVTVLMGLIVWGMLWGVVGMLLATPITAICKIGFEQLEPTRPVARLLAGRFGEPRAADS